MEEATVIEWRKVVGDSIEEGEVVLIIETDKAEGDVESDVRGRLVDILASPGDIVHPRDVLGRIELHD